MPNTKRIKKSGSDDKARTDDLNPSTSINRRKASQANAFNYSSLLEVTKRAYPDDFKHIPFQLLRPRKSTNKPLPKPKFKRKKSTKSKPLVVEPPVIPKDAFLPPPSSIWPAKDVKKDESSIKVLRFEDQDSDCSEQDSLIVGYSSDIENRSDVPTEVASDHVEEDEEPDYTIFIDYIEEEPYFMPFTVKSEVQSESEDEHVEETFNNFFRSTTNSVWNNYTIENKPIEPHDLLATMPATGIDKLFTPTYFEKLNPVERRIHLEGQKFRIAENESFQWSLYRSVARAATGSESNFKTARKDILTEILSDWMAYYTEIVEICGYNLLQLPIVGESNLLLDRYKAYFLSTKNGSPLFELRAAARKYGFNFVLVDVNNYEDQATVLNSSEMEIINDSSEIIYHFLRTGSLPESWCYEFLIPLGPPSAIPNGVYPFSMYNVILVDRQYDEAVSIQMRRADHLLPNSTTRPTSGFGLDHRMFFYKPTYTNDLWSLLSELLFHKLYQAPDIYEMTLRAKFKESKFYHFSKLKKKRLKGRGLDSQTISKLANSLKISPSFKGHPIDLEHAASFFHFSYTLIGLDNSGNFFWKECISKAGEAGKEPPIFAFFVRFMKNRDHNWYALEEAKFNCPKEIKLYQGITFADDTKRSRKLYHHAGPCVTAKNTSVKADSKWGLILSHVNTGRKWLAKGMSQLITRTRMDVVAHQVSRASVGLISRLRGFIYRFRPRVRVHPELSIRELYMHHP